MRISMKKLQQWIDKISTAVSVLMIAAMMFILVFNIVMRLIPKIGGVSWYMESSQYLNVWAMVIIGIQITVTGGHLRVEVIDALVKNSPAGKKIVKVIDELFIILFYVIAAYASFLLEKTGNYPGLSPDRMLRAMRFFFAYVPVCIEKCWIYVPVCMRFLGQF